MPIRFIDRSPAARTFFKILLLDDELANLALKDSALPLKRVSRIVNGIGSLEQQCHIGFEFLLPRRDLGHMDFVVASNLSDSLEPLNGFAGDPRLEGATVITSGASHENLLELGY